MEYLVLTIEFLFYFFINDGKGDMDKRREVIGSKIPKVVFYLICMVVMVILILLISMIIFAINFILSK